MKGAMRCYLSDTGDDKIKTMTDEKVQKYSEQLEALGIRYQALDHPHFVEADKVQAYLNDDLSGSCPTLIFKAGGRFIALVKRGDVKLDSGKLKKILGVSNLRMANKEEFENLTGVPVGAARVFNPGISTYLDKSIFEKEYLNGGTGSFTVTFKYKTSDLRKIPGAKEVDVTEGGKKRIFAGMRPTGRLHLGNYLGSAQGMLELQNNPDYETVFMVVDLHGITTPYDKNNLQENIKNVMLDYLAIGLDPEKGILTVQSMVPEHLELAYLLSTTTTIAKMSHLPTYKEKVKQYPENNTMALLYYPVLMAADILIYKAELVPVGIDQEPHLETAREIARRMNQEYGTDFPEPVRFATKGEYVPSLTGEGKMSKTVEGSYINLTDSHDEIKTKIAKVPTDEGRGFVKEKDYGEVLEVVYQIHENIFPGTGNYYYSKDGRRNDGLRVLMALVDLFMGNEKRKVYEQEYKNGIKYKTLKDDLSRAIFNEIQPIQERRKEIEARPGYVEKVIAEGAEKARVKAQITLKEVKEKMGLI